MNVVRLARGCGGRPTRLEQKHNPKALHFGNYLNRSTIHLADTLPLDLSAAVPGWLMTAMFANGPDSAAPPQIASTGVGDCVWAACVRSAAMSALSVGKTLWTNYPDALKAALKGYAECTGWNVNNSDATDRGTDPTAAWKYLTDTGLLCSDGTYTKILGSVQVNYNDTEEVYLGQNLVGGMSIGVDLPQDWEHAMVLDATNSPTVGGHEGEIYSDLFIPNAYNGNILLNWWGERLTMTEAGRVQRCNQLTALVWSAAFGPGKANIGGFDYQHLMDDLSATQGA